MYDEDCWEAEVDRYLEYFKPKDSWALIQKSRFSTPNIVKVIHEDVEYIRVIEYGFGEMVYSVALGKVLMFGSQKDLSKKLSSCLQIRELVDTNYNNDFF